MRFDYRFADSDSPWYPAPFVAYRPLDADEVAEVRLASLPSNAWSADDMERDSDHYLRVDAGWRMRLGENGRLHLGAGAETWDDIAAHFEVGASLAF